MFLRDAKQAEVMLSQQENYLSKDETPTSLEQAENMLKRHQDFLTTMDANDEKIKVLFIIGSSNIYLASLFCVRVYIVYQKFAKFIVFPVMRFQNHSGGCVFWRPTLW